MEIVLELSCCKHPPAKALRHHWAANKEALLSYMEKTHAGVKGIVTNSVGEDIYCQMVVNSTLLLLQENLYLVPRCSCQVLIGT